MYILKQSHGAAEVVYMFLSRPMSWEECVKVLKVYTCWEILIKNFCFVF